MDAKYLIVSDEEFIKCYHNSNSFSQFYRNLGYSGGMQKSSKDGIALRMQTLGLPKDKFIKKIKEKNVCLCCGKETVYKFYCSLQCKKQFEDEQKIIKWKQTGNTSCGVSTTLRNCIRDYILKKQNNLCAICGMPNQWNNKVLKFILDHIDGDASNNFESNLRLICPNCDSQLDTYKSKNKHSARNFRKNYT